MAIAGDYETYRGGMQRTLETILSGQIPGFQPPRLPAGMTPASVAATMASWAPLVVGASFVPMLAFNLWLAAKATHMSGRLPRPWPQLPAMALPLYALGYLAAALALAILFDGWIGFFARAALGGLIAAFLFNGLAAIHLLSLGKPWRFGVLAGVYVSLLIASQIIAPLIALFGLIDCAFRLRERGAPPSQPPALT